MHSGTLARGASPCNGSDEGPNGEIIYSFSSHNRAGVRELFSLDLAGRGADSQGSADFEDAKLHEIYIQAKDKGASPEGAYLKFW